MAKVLNPSPSLLPSDLTPLSYVPSKPLGPVEWTLPPPLITNPGLEPTPIITRETLDVSFLLGIIDN